MFLRANVLAKGYSGVRIHLLNTLMSMINRGIHPVIPEIGSVGASGDLVPLAHMALAMMGEGNVEYNGRVIGADSALEKEGIDEVRLDSKEGIALINGTSVMAGLGALTCYDSQRLVKEAEIAARNALKISRSVECIVAIEMISAAQAIDLRGSGKLGKGTIKAYQIIRKILPPIVEDRETYVDIARLVGILRSEELVRAVESSIGQLN